MATHTEPRLQELVCMPLEYHSTLELLKVSYTIAAKRQVKSRQSSSGENSQADERWICPLYLSNVERGILLPGYPVEALAESSLEDVLSQSALVVARCGAMRRLLLEGHMYLCLLNLLVCEYTVPRGAVGH